MSKKDERRLVACEQCERTYPGFRRAGGDLHVVGGPACPNCGSSSLVEVDFEPSLTLSCPNCGTEHRERVELPYDTTDVERPHHDPDGVVEVTCAECETAFDVGTRPRSDRVAASNAAAIPARRTGRRPRRGVG